MKGAEKNSGTLAIEPWLTLLRVVRLLPFKVNFIKKIILYLNKLTINESKEIPSIHWGSHNLE
jgi:hypothetical protein